MPKHFVEKTFCAVFQKVPVAKKFMDKRGGASMVSVESFFCLTVPKNFVWEPFSVSLSSGMETFYASEGYVTFFCRNCFVSQCRKFP